MSTAREMKRLTASLLVSVLVLSFFVLVFAEEEKPSATQKLCEGQVGLGVG